ncbi:MAG: LysR family transcriptional regulator [Clostridiales bacterium]|jgi:hypothetical protein|nr:LysR family transcriptional regulator [Clostridiales bacterium]MDR2750909.1 LysR family transcriptional regulator [Clostridiales bacterium]
MTIQQLRYFIACGSLRSFKTAAFISHCSPSTITRQIAALEEELGITLFNRDTHNVQITDEGGIFFSRAIRMLITLDDFDDELTASGRKKPREKPEFRIAVYTNDGTFSKIASAIEDAYPSERIGKPYRFYHPYPGGMMKAVLESGYQLGVESRALLAEQEERVKTQFLFKSPFRIVAGSETALFGRDSVSNEEIFQKYGRFGCFIPKELGPLEIRDKPIRSSKDLKDLGEFLITKIPDILPLLVRFDTPKDLMLLQPSQINLNQSVETSTVKLADESVYTEYMLFWKQEEDDPALGVFLRLIERHSKKRPG